MSGRRSSSAEGRPGGISGGSDCSASVEPWARNSAIAKAQAEAEKARAREAAAKRQAEETAGREAGLRQEIEDSKKREREAKEREAEERKEREAAEQQAEKTRNGVAVAVAILFFLVGIASLLGQVVDDRAGKIVIACVTAVGVYGALSFISSNIEKKLINIAALLAAVITIATALFPHDKSDRPVSKDAKEAPAGQAR